MKWLKTLPACLAMLLLCACGGISFFDADPPVSQGNVSYGPAGNISRTKGYVFVYNDNFGDQFVVPPVPAGAARLFGNLDSTYPEARRNYTWKAKALLKPGEERSGEAWFYVDFDPATGAILDARAYAWGMDRHAEYLGFFEKYKGSFGSITEKGFELQIAGASGGNGTWQGENSNWEAPAVIFIRGSADLLGKKNGARVPFTYEALEVPGKAINIESSYNKGTVEADTRTVTKDELVDKGEGTAFLTQ